jgi:hypothetical protein
MAKVPSKARLNEKTNRIIDARSKGLELAIARWLQKLARRMAKREWQRVKGKVAKARDDAKLERAELESLLRDYGMRVYSETANIAGVASAPSFSVPRRTQALIDKGASVDDVVASLPDGFPVAVETALETVLSENRGASFKAIREKVRRKLATDVYGDVALQSRNADRFFAQIPELVDYVYARTNKAASASVNRLLADAAKEEPRPSAGEVARRIRQQFHGAGAGRITGQADLPTSAGALTRYSTEEGTQYAFSAERAALIARTELGKAANNGLAEGYAVAGVKEIEWIAYSDGRSGDRHHERMDGKKRRMDGPLFKTPLGNECRWPHDPRLPVRDVANCRCTVAPVIKVGGKR